MTFYHDIITKQKYCYNSIKQFSTKSTINLPIKFYPVNEFYANKISIEFAEERQLESNHITQHNLLTIAKHWIDFISKDTRPIYSRKTKQGFWNHLSLKINTKSQLMVKLLVVTIDDKYLDYFEKDFFNQFIDDIDGQYNIVHQSIFFQHSHNQSCPIKDDNLVLFYGTNGIQEEILGINFWISPSTFSQANSYTCDQLYQTVHQFIDYSFSDQIVCYGRNVGHICFTLTNVLDKKIIGYNPCPVVHDDLIKTINTNLIIHNIELHLDIDCQKISNTLQFVNDSIIVLIVSPGRNGLKKNLAQAISCSRKTIRQFYYISCYTKSLVRDLNLIGNCYIERAQAIDLFPGTKFCEVIVKVVLF